MPRRQTKLWKARKKAIGRSPAWLKTAIIAKSSRQAIPGSFGPASPVVSIDPATGEPRAG